MDLAILWKICDEHIDPIHQRRGEEIVRVGVGAWFDYPYANEHNCLQFLQERNGHTWHEEFWLMLWHKFLLLCMNTRSKY